MFASASCTTECLDQEVPPWDRHFFPSMNLGGDMPRDAENYLRLMIADIVLDIVL